MDQREVDDVETTQALAELEKFSGFIDRMRNWDEDAKQPIPTWMTGTINTKGQFIELDARCLKDILATDLSAKNILRVLEQHIQALNSWAGHIQAFLVQVNEVGGHILEAQEGLDDIVVGVLNETDPKACPGCMVHIAGALLEFAAELSEVLVDMNFVAILPSMEQRIRGLEAVGTATVLANRLNAFGVAGAITQHLIKRAGNELATFEDLDEGLDDEDDEDEGHEETYDHD